MRKLITPKNKTKREKGQILVMVAITITALVTIVGLAVDMGYMYVSYARLRRAADSAALAASGEFKRTASDADMYNAAEQFLNLNGTAWTSITINTCYFIYSDIKSNVPPIYYQAFTPYTDASNLGGRTDEPAATYVCTSPRRKMVQVIVTEDVPTFFLAIIGWRKIPISVTSISEAASLDIVLVLDKSESMAQYQADGVTPLPVSQRDPYLCNPVNDCHPFKEVKQAAEDFISGYLESPYDRAAIVTFAQMPKVETIVEGGSSVIGFSSSIPDIVTTIQGLDVYMGGDDGVSTSFGGENKCDDDKFGNYTHGHPELSVNAITVPLPSAYNYQCRRYYWSNDDDGTTPWSGIAAGTRGAFDSFDCPGVQAAATLGQPLDYSKCQSSNIGGGLGGAADVISGSTGTAGRPEALWVTILLTDGLANSSSNDKFTATNPNGIPWCNGTGSQGTEKDHSPNCRDRNALVRHCLYATYTDAVTGYTYRCMDQTPPTSGAPDKDHPSIAGTTMVLDTPPINYDADDYARDAADFLYEGTHSLIFVIGLGPEITLLAKGTTSLADIVAGVQTPAPGATLLNYVAAKGDTNGYYPSDSAGLNKVFLAIANRIATRLTH